MGGSSSLPCDCSRGVARVFKGGSSQAACTLRIVQITDVYVLDNFPSLRTLIKEKTLELRHKCGGQTISMLTGDFLAPYLLSSIDMGVGMMKMLNGTPIDYLTWGNHEDDIPHKEVMKREREYTGVWINTNMKTHESFADSTCQVEEEIIEVESLDGSNKRRIGLIGILSNSPSLYRPGAFGGAKIEDPWEVMAIYKKKLEEQKACDAAWSKKWNAIGFISFYMLNIVAYPRYFNLRCFYECSQQFGRTRSFFHLPGPVCQKMLSGSGAFVPFVRAAGWKDLQGLWFSGGAQRPRSSCGGPLGGRNEALKARARWHQSSDSGPVLAQCILQPVASDRVWDRNLLGWNNASHFWVQP